MYHGLDTARCPDPSAIADLPSIEKAMTEVGKVDWLGVYIGLPGDTPYPINKTGFDALRSAYPSINYRLLAVPHAPPFAMGYGSSFAMDTLAAAKALGITPKRIYIDVEANWWSDIANVLQFLSEATGIIGPMKTGVYTSPIGVMHIAGLPASVRPENIWFGDWLGTEPMDLNPPGFPPSMFDGPGQRVWQWKGATQLGGMGTYDLNISDDAGDSYPLTVSDPTPSPKPAPTLTQYPTPTAPPGDVVPVLMARLKVYETPMVSPNQQVTIKSLVTESCGAVLNDYGQVVYVGSFDSGPSIGSSGLSQYTIVCAGEITYEVVTQ